MKKKDQLQLFWIIIFVSVGVFFLLSLVYGQTEEFKYDPQIGIDKQLGKFEISEKYSLMSSEIEGCELVDYYNTGDDGARDNYQTASRRLAQVFTASETYTLCSVKLKMYGAGGDAGDIQISIKEVDGNNKPTGSDISSGTYTEQLPQGSGAADWIEISMSEIELQNETQYAIIVYAPDITGEIYVAWNDDETSPEYTGGHYTTSIDGVNWTNDAGKDVMFETYQTTSIEPPGEVLDTSFASSSETEIYIFYSSMLTNLILLIVLFVLIPK